MKRFLLSWYGIADLRAALGIVDGEGPVLGALSTGRYTHVLILAYTDPAKARSVDEAEQRAWLARLDQAAAGDLTLSPKEQQEAVDALSNTPLGNETFKVWLHGTIKARRLGVSIRMVEASLDSLCDAKGTHEAASAALEVVLATPGEKEITVFLSPGTPVMAFTWAFVALVNPQARVQVIASPDYRAGPQEVRLPYDLLTPKSRKRRVAAPGERGEFDTVFHLFGEQRLPSLLGVRQFNARRHVFISNARFPSTVMRRFLPAGAEFSELSVDPFDPLSTKVAILRDIADAHGQGRFGFNLTGGTKLMFAGALAACRKVHGIPFYFETREHQLVFLDDFTTTAIQGVEEVEQFFALANFAVSHPGRWNGSQIREARLGLTRALWNNRRRLAKLYRDLSSREPAEPFSLQRGPIEARLGKDLVGVVRIGGSEFLVDGDPRFASYLCGGWLEEYAYSLLSPLMDDGLLRDLRIGLKLSWDGGGLGGSVDDAQEFDVTGTDGRRLFIVECKAGYVGSEDVYRLANSVRSYAGLEGRGILMAAFPPSSSAAVRRLRADRRLTVCAGKDAPWSLVRTVRGLVEGAGKSTS